MDGEVEALRTWLLGGFRMSVGPSRSIGDEDWHLRKAGNLVKLLALTPGYRLHREPAETAVAPRNQHDPLPYHRSSFAPPIEAYVGIL